MKNMDIFFVQMLDPGRIPVDLDLESIPAIMTEEDLSIPIRSYILFPSGFTGTRWIEVDVK